MNKPNLLYLVHRIPFPPNKGDKVRSFNTLKFLSQHFDIHLGCFIDDPHDLQYRAELHAYSVSVKCVQISPLRNKIRSLTGLLSGKALTLPYYQNTELQSWVDQTLADSKIRSILVYSSSMAQFVDKHSAVDGSTGIRYRRVMDFVDIDSDKWRQYSESRSWPMNWVYSREASKLKAYEDYITTRFDAVTFVSSAEAELFARVTHADSRKIDWFANGVATEFFDPELDYSAVYDGPTIVFTGAMDYWANIDALLWFYRHVWPLLRVRHEQVRLYIVGSKPTKIIRQLDDGDRVRVTGRVEDIRPYIAEANVSVAPLQIARGIQNKILEAMAMAVPVVASSAALEGLEGDELVEAMRADEPELFAEKCLAYLDRKQVKKSYREYVFKHYHWDTALEKLLLLLSDDQ